MVNKSFDFYKDNLPYGFPVIAQTTWEASDVTPTLDVAPETSYILFVKSISYIMTQDFAISAGDLTIGHSDAAAPNDVLTIDHEDQILSLGGVGGLEAFPTGTNKVFGEWKFDPPIKCDAASSESFEIKEGSALTLVGHIHFTVHGWQMLKTDYEEVT